MMTPVEQAQMARPAEKSCVNFSDGNREAHLRAFYAWLPTELHDAPGISWANASSRILGYCVKTVGESPDKGYVALAIGAAIGSLGQASLHQYLSRFYQLLCMLRTVCGIGQLSELRNKEVWEAFAQSTAVTLHRYHLLRAYTALGEKHVRFYLEHRAAKDRERLSVYTLPPLPPRFMERHGAEQMLVGQSQQRRKERSDILVPLYHVLVALIQLRKQAAERMILACREACQRGSAGEALPLHFAYEEHLPTVNRTARMVADVRIDGRAVSMQFRLWDRRSWTLAHRECFSTTTLRDAERREGSYRPEAEEYFLQFDGPASDLLWFGDLVAHRLLQQLNLHGPSDEAYQRRLAAARQVGARQGFSCSRPSLLTPSREEGFWLTRVGSSVQPCDLVFAPEQLYRGCLYGAALATIALTNGSRVNELLQVSLDRRKIRTETLVVTRDGKAEQRKTCAGYL
jgi:hypothetical protein